ncbi:desiccation protectant protein Lea14 homolog [Argentina anserina]|uniref:desiccation protectant protein Lea14 homolog n=1 Tax=Argentina anserina TaxID=57926 RepID=UPI0021762BCB|nr:desiccation protectant protein Lea14 homolog [Potentilla anserina]
MAQLFGKASNFVTEKLGKVEKPEADLTDVDFRKASFDAAEYVGKVHVKNPYDHSIPICEITYKLRCAGREIASGTVPDPGSIKGNDVTLLEVPVKVPHSVLATLVKDVGADWDIDYELILGLTIDLPVIGNFTMPLSKKGEIKLPSLNSFFG